MPDTILGLCFATAWELLSRIGSGGEKYFVSVAKNWLRVGLFPCTDGILCLVVFGFSVAGIFFAVATALIAKYTQEGTKVLAGAAVAFLYLYVAM